MVNIAPRQVFVPSPQLMVAFTGLEGDVQSLTQELSRQVASKLGRGLGFMNEIRQQRPIISPRAMASLTSHILYNRKQAPYYVEPLVIGLTETLESKPADVSIKDGTNDDNPLDRIAAKNTLHFSVLWIALGQNQFQRHLSAREQPPILFSEPPKPCGNLI